MSRVKWTPGPAPGFGRWWVAWAGRDGLPRVELIDVSPAVLVPDGRLLLKFLGGMAFDFEANIDRMSHHAPLVVPELPKSIRSEHRNAESNSADQE